MAKNKKSNVIANLGLATVGGLATGFVKNELDKMIAKGTTKIDPRIVSAAPLVGAYFLADTEYYAAAYGIAGACGLNLGHDFGLYGLSDDEIQNILN